MKKILRYGKPLIHHTPGDTLRMCVLEGYSNYKPLLYGMNNILAPEIQFEDGTHLLDVKFYYDIPEIVVKTVPKSIIGDIIETIKNAIEQDYYVLLNVDTCEISNYAKYKSGICYPHEICIYGIDTSNKILFCADFFDGKEYSCEEVSFADFLNAYTSLKECSRNINFHTGGAEWLIDVQLLKYFPEYSEQFNIEKLKKNIQYFLNSENIWGHNICTYERPHIMAQNLETSSKMLFELKGRKEYYGIAVFEEVLEYYKRYASGDDKYIISSKLLYIIYAFQRFMYLRLEYISKNDLIQSDKYESILNDYYNLVQQSRTVLNIELKFRITKLEKHMDRLIEVLGVNIQETQKLLQKIAVFLEDVEKSNRIGIH